MTRLGAATTLCEILPREVMERLLGIWQEKGDYQVVMDFKDGRCLRMKVTDSQQFENEDFTKGAEA